MNEQEYTEGNELISEFMELKRSGGWHTYPSAARGSCKAQFLEYHHNRNWLHAAWEKFRDLRFDIPKHELEHSEFRENIAYNICFQSTERAFQSIVSGIQWYNSINK
jgi:hypothetical protein